MDIQVQEKQERFLEAFVERRGVLAEAREDAGVTKGQFYQWMQNADFRARFDNYRLALAEEIESVAVARVLNPEGQRGSDALATTLLKGLKKSRYSDQGNSAVGMQVIYVSQLRDKPRPGLEGGTINALQGPGNSESEITDVQPALVSGEPRVSLAAETEQPAAESRKDTSSGEVQSPPQQQ